MINTTKLQKKLNATMPGPNNYRRTIARRRIGSHNIMHVLYVIT